MNPPSPTTRGTNLLKQLLEDRGSHERSYIDLLRPLAERIWDQQLLNQPLRERIDLLAERYRDQHDPFGFDPDYISVVLPIAAWVYNTWFRVEAHGIENIPDGPVLLIANHSGQLPVDGMMIVSSCLLAKNEPRMVRSMVERWVPSLPFVSWFFARTGQILGTRDNFRLLTEIGSAILVFPEGVGGISKTYDKAYQLQNFGLGFMRLALENNLPIVPIGVVGAEEQAPALYDLKPLARLLGIPAFPITPTFPLFGPLGLLPLPVKYHLHFGEPLLFSGNPDDEDRLIQQKVQVVKDEIQSLLRRGLQERRGIFT
jgi:1-acyl-sn-glycerol-3-phosphate acyltransferase